MKSRRQKADLTHEQLSRLTKAIDQLRNRPNEPRVAREHFQERMGCGAKATTHANVISDAPNPCQGVRGFTEAGRDRYVTDAEFKAVHAAAHPTVRDAMDVALLTGQRPADVLKIRRDDLHDGALHITQNKTGAKRAIEISGELAQVIERINARARERLSAFLIQDDNGRPLSMLALRSRFDKARKTAGVAFQFRDIRAKTASDTGDLGHSQSLLGHKNRDMTEHYVRPRIGQRVKPLR